LTVLALSLSGPVQGHTLSLALDGSHVSSGPTSIEAIGTADDPMFRITSFFDVFAELTLDSTPPLSATRGPVRVELGVPEPASLVLPGLGLAGLAAWSRRRTA
jgi:hypothetical protein